MASLSDVIDAYLADRRARGTSAATVRNEKQVLRLLLAEVGNISPTSFRPQHIDRFWAARSSWGPGTMNRARACLSMFFQWCRNRNHMPRDLDPLAGSRKLRVPLRDRTIIPQPEFETFLENIENPRSRMAAACGLYLFNRISETEVLRWRDWDLSSRSVQVTRPKTGQVDVLPICDELAIEFRRWQLSYSAKVGDHPKPNAFLIPGLPNGGGSYSVKGKQGFQYYVGREWCVDKRSNLNYSIREVLEQANYYRPYEGGHTLRRSGGIALYNQLSSIGHDRSIRVCQAMYGHASVSTTEIYLRLDLDRKVRNDLLAGKRMFPETGTAQVLRLTEGTTSGQEDVGAVRV